jgi:FdhE protein
MSSKLRNSLQTIENYKIASPHYNEILDILGEILIVREEYRNNLKDSIFSVDENIIAQKMEGGLPLIDFAGGNFDLTRPREYFNSLIAIAERKMPEDAKSIVDIIRDQKFDWEKMIKASFDHVEDETAADNRQKLADAEDDLDLIDLFVEESLRPELEYVADKYSKTVAKFGWTEGYCPICGKEPKIGEIRGEEEGKRYLFCHQCGYKWNFRRIKCPFCGNEEQQSLAYFAVEGEERYHVDVCNKCRRYIKTIELSQAAGEINLDVEDIATLHLDMLAYEEGYN